MKWSMQLQPKNQINIWHHTGQDKNEDNRLPAGKEVLAPACNRGNCEPCFIASLQDLP